MRTVLVIGLGRFGRHLALKLSELGHEVMAIDKDEESVNKIAPYVTAAQIGNCTDEIVLKDVGVNNFDVCFVCISNNLETSLVITSLLKEQRAKQIVSKVNQDIHAKFLLQNGANEVIYPERDMAERTAIKYCAKEAFDYVELNNKYGIFEIATPFSWVGKSIHDIDVRENYSLNVIAYKRDSEILPVTNSFVFEKYEHLIVAGDKKNFSKLVNKKVIV